jgi:hypothetical protein
VLDCNVIDLVVIDLGVAERQYVPEADNVARVRDLSSFTVRIDLLDAAREAGVIRLLAMRIVSRLAMPINYAHTDSGDLLRSGKLDVA